MAFKMRSPLHAEPFKQNMPTQGTLGKPKTGKTQETAKSSTDKPETSPKPKTPPSTESKTPTIDKFMQMNQRPSTSSNEPSYFDKVKKKASMVADVVGKATGVSNVMDAAQMIKKSGKSFEEWNPLNKEEQSIIRANTPEAKAERKRKDEKAQESAEARTQLPAPGNMSALYNTKPVTFSGQTSNAGKISTGSRASQLNNVDPFRSNTEQMEVDDKGTNTTTKDNVTNSNTGAEESVSGEDQTMADKLIEENEGDDSTSAERLYDRNPAMYARRKARQDKRDIRRKKREERIVARNYGIEEGKKVGESYTGPSSIKEAKYETPGMNNEVEDFSTEDEIITNEQGTFRRSKNKDNVVTKFEKVGPGNAMTPNRAGRPINSNMLMTSPVVKTGKHSAKDAVAKLRMRNIAQSE